MTATKDTAWPDCRSDFPIYGRSPAPHYLDSAAGTFRPQMVIDAVTEYYSYYPVNVHRSMHRLSEQATDAFEDARDTIASFVNARDCSETIFTRGTTESINLVADCWSRSNLCRGRAILLTELEHHSNMIPWRLVAEQHGLEIRYAPVHADGSLDMEAFHHLLSPEVGIVSVNHMSNVLGTLNPVEEIISAAHELDVLVCIDAAQSAAHIPLDVQVLDCDFLAFSSHKMFGPSGIGVLYGRSALLEELPPYLGGGDMINTVTLDGTTWADLPARLEAGTPHIAGAIGLGAAVRYIETIGFETITQITDELTDYLLEALRREVPEAHLIGGDAKRHGVVSFTIDGIHPHDVAQFANEHDVAIRAGSLCAQPLVHRLGHNAVCRASLAIYNNEEDINQLITALKEAVRFFHAT